MTEHTEHLPPCPKRLDVIIFLWFLAAALGSHNLVLGWLGTDPAWPWFPYRSVGMTMLLVVLPYYLWFTRKPFGPHAPWTTQRLLSNILAVVAVFAAVLVPSAVA